MSRFKACKKEELNPEDPDEAAFSISYSADMTEILLRLKANRAIQADEYVASLAQFAEESMENPGDLFLEENSQLH